MLIIVLHFVSAQDISWEQVNDVPEGYQYVMDSNENREMVTAGVELDGNYPMQLHYRNPEGEWSQIPGNDLVASMVESIHITNNQEIYACDFAMGLFRSSDFGQNWTGVAELIENGCSAFNIHENGTLFIGLTYTFGFIHQSLDHGKTWIETPLPDYSSSYPVEHIEFDSQGNIFLGTINGVYGSMDLSESWQKMNSGLGGAHISTMYIDENDHIYVYTTYSGTIDGLYYSTNSANSWINIPLTGSFYFVLDMVVKNQVIYAMNSLSDFFISNNMGENWVNADDGINDNSLYSMHLDMDDYLYVGGRYLHRSIQNISGNISGDINLDGIINILDVIEIITLILENTAYNGLADLNSDGLINVMDVIQLVNIILSS